MPTTIITIPDDEDLEPELFDPAPEPEPAPEQYDLFTEVLTSQDAPGEAHKVACWVAYPDRDRRVIAIVRGRFGGGWSHRSGVTCSDWIWLFR